MQSRLKSSTPIPAAADRSKKDRKRNYNLWNLADNSTYFWVHQPLIQIRLLQRLPAFAPLSEHLLPATAFVNDTDADRKPAMVEIL